MAYPLRYGAVSLAVVLFLGVGTTSGENTGRKKGDISAPVSYKDLMLILTTSEGAAAVVFTEESERGVGYRFRYQSWDGRAHTTGTGQVFEKYKDGVYDGGVVFIAAGPIKIGWSHCDPGKGWLYYNPNLVRVHIAHADNFEGGKRGFGGDVSEKLDLTRFMK